MTTYEQAPAGAESGGPMAAVSVQDEPLAPDTRRVWLVPLVLLLFLLAPLFRDGLPATQAGVLPLHPALASLMTPPAALPLFFGGAVAYKFMLALHVILAAVAVGALARALWGGATAWWTVALWLTLPFTTSLALQNGWLHPWQGITLLAAGGILALSGRLPLRLFALLLWAWGISLLWVAQPALAPAQLFSFAWPSPENAREWVSGTAYGVGLVPIALALLAALVAWPRRHDARARRVLRLGFVAAACLLLTLIGGPVALWLAVGSLALLLAAGGLLHLDPRYASFPALVASVVVAALGVLPALRPAWLDTPPTTANVAQFVGDAQFLLLNVEVQREGETVTIAATWQATRPPASDFSAFVHLLDAQGTIVAQADALLLDGDEVPSSRWPVGYVVMQQYVASTPQAPVQVRLGLYDGQTLERLPFGDGGDSVVVPVP